MQLWVRVSEPPPTVWDDMKANGTMIAFSAGLIISMFFVGFLIAVLQTRRKAQLMRRPPPMRTAVKIRTAPKLPPKAPYLPPGKVPKKVVRKKTVTGSDIEATKPTGAEELIEPERASGLKFKTPAKRSVEEDLPDDWK